MRIVTLPVYSKLADEQDVPPEIQERMPAGWHLSAHQVATYQALKSGDADVVFNVAMTGDGKSLAAYLPVLVNNAHAFGMYPTIELLRDQARGFEGYCSGFQCPVTCLPLWGSEMTKLTKKQSFRERGEWLVAQFRNYGVILTNPDIFNLVMNYRYRTFIYSAVELPYSLGIGYDYFVFDEFHVFEMPQVVSALTALLWLVEHGAPRSPKFVFSSATPDPVLREMIERVGLKYTLVESDYVTEVADGYRPILHQADLHLHKLGERETAEDWLRAHLEELVAFWRSADSRRPKGLIVVNSVATARRIGR